MTYPEELLTKALTEESMALGQTTLYLEALKKNLVHSGFQTLQVHEERHAQALERIAQLKRAIRRIKSYANEHLILLRHTHHPSEQDTIRYAAFLDPAEEVDKACKKQLLLEAEKLIMVENMVNEQGQQSREYILLIRQEDSAQKAIESVKQTREK
jgi:hypothetical protein